MNCYLCLVEEKNTTQPAYAFCQDCGAGICNKHMIELIYPPIIGPGGTSPRYKLICCRCYHIKIPHSSTRKNHIHKYETSPVRQWWQHLWSRRPPLLPEPAEAVVLVEQFLKEERSS